MAKPLLVDTTYLLSIFSIRVDLPRCEEIFPKLVSRRTVFYNPLPVVEARWIALRLAKKLGSHVLERFRLGGKALLNDGRSRPTSTTSYKIVSIANSSILHLSDYFDRMIVVTAYTYSCTLSDGG